MFSADLGWTAIYILLRENSYGAQCAANKVCYFVKLPQWLHINNDIKNNCFRRIRQHEHNYIQHPFLTFQHHEI